MICLEQVCSSLPQQGARHMLNVSSLRESQGQRLLPAADTAAPGEEACERHHAKSWWQGHLACGLPRAWPQLSLTTPGLHHARAAPWHPAHPPFCWSLAGATGAWLETVRALTATPRLLHRETPPAAPASLSHECRHTPPSLCAPPTPQLRQGKALKSGKAPTGHNGPPRRTAAYPRPLRHGPARPGSPLRAGPQRRPRPAPCGHVVRAPQRRCAGAVPAPPARTTLGLWIKMAAAGVAPGGSGRCWAGRMAAAAGGEAPQGAPRWAWAGSGAELGGTAVEGRGPDGTRPDRRRPRGGVPWAGGWLSAPLRRAGRAPRLLRAGAFRARLVVPSRQLRRCGGAGVRAPHRPAGSPPRGAAVSLVPLPGVGRPSPQGSPIRSTGGGLVAGAVSSRRRVLP